MSVLASLLITLFICWWDISSTIGQGTDMVLNTRAMWLFVFLPLWGILYFIISRILNFLTKILQRNKHVKRE